MDQPLATQGVGGPFVAVATFCERVLQEKDGVNTLVRLVDRYTVREAPPDAAPPGAQPGFETYLFVLVKSGDFTGQATLTVRIRRPSGVYASKAVVETPLTLNGGEHGVAIAIRLLMGVEEVGLHWADIELNGNVVTRVPLRIELRSKQPSEPATMSDVSR